jgi:hypothetical protein
MTGVVVKYYSAASPLLSVTSSHSSVNQKQIIGLSLENTHKKHEGVGGGSSSLQIEKRPQVARESREREKEESHSRQLNLSPKHLSSCQVMNYGDGESFLDITPLGPPGPLKYIHTCMVHVQKN